jgi:hypothetical protein
MRADSGRSQGRFQPQPQLGPQLSETRSDGQELREAEAARRGLRNSERNCGESRTREGHSEPTRNESSQRQDDHRYQQQQEAQIHEDPVIVHPTLALIEAAEPGGKDEQRQGSYCRPTPPALQKVTLSHRKPRRKNTASGVPRELLPGPVRKSPKRLAARRRLRLPSRKPADRRAPPWGLDAPREPPRGGGHRSRWAAWCRTPSRSRRFLSMPLVRIHRG